MKHSTKNIFEIKNKDFDKKMGALREFIKNNKPFHDEQARLMGILHKTQDIFGYIPRQAIECISEKIQVPVAHIYGMATFYNYFSLKPKGVYRIYTCKGTACYVGGGARILAKVKEELGIDVDQVTADGLFSLNITRCLGCCGLSPVMQVNDDIYVRMVPEKVSGILKRYRKMHLKAKIQKKRIPSARTAA
jgi:NADH:ubiquinone oxidoreductase subunit E